MEPFSGLAGGETSVKTQIDDLTIGCRKQNDNFPKQAKHLFFLSQTFRIPTGVFYLFRQGVFSETKVSATDILGGVGDDSVNPGAGLGATTAGPSGLQDLDPTDLKGVFGQIVVAGDPLGQRKETPGTARNPGFAIAFKEGAVFGGPLQFRSG